MDINNAKAAGVPGFQNGAKTPDQRNKVAPGGAELQQHIPQQVEPTSDELQDKLKARNQAIVAVIGFGLLAAKGASPQVLAAFGFLTAVCLFNYKF